MVCKSCNTSNPPGNKFCTVCGNSLGSANNKVCANGHIYDSSLAQCPYCPSSNLKSKLAKGPEGITDTFTPGSSKGKDITKIMNKEQSKASNKTIIVSKDDEQSPKNSGRKLMGWLVSFSLNPNGQDFKLYEGRNLISGDPNGDIYLNDPAVSTPHCMILFRGDKIRIKDELSTNGTMHNGAEIDEAELKDGDVIKVGRTELKFRSI